MKSLLILSLLVSLVGCNSDPYPSAGDRLKDPRKPTVVKDPPNGMNIDSKVEFTEGEPGLIKYKVNVPSPGQPVVWVEDLPQGAVFNKADSTITWTPDYYAGNNLKDPTIKSRDYEFTIYYRSNLDDPKTAQKEKVTIIVYDKPREFVIDTAKEKTVSEGNTLSYHFTIKSVDYPQGPFKVYTQGMPANTIVEKISNTEYRLVFTPDYHHVKINANPNPCGTSDNDCLLYTPKITVNNPANHETDVDIKIKVQDVRQNITLVTPTSTDQGLDMSFGIASVDPNGEVAPKIFVSSGEPKPGYGQFETDLVKDEENNSSVLNVKWRDIPLSMNGKFHTFTFKSCVLSSLYSYNDCDTKTLKVKIVVKKRNAPVFARSEWEQGEIKYLKYNERQTYSIDITDGDTNIDVNDVKVVPEAMKKFVSFSNGNLNVRFDKPGIHQFSLVATSNYNVASAESFMVEVFSKDRFRTIYLTDSTRNDEVRFYKEVMGDVQLINPAIMPLYDRVLSGRDNLIVGTDILADPSMSSHIERAMTFIDKVVVASSLIENMPAKFLEELQNDFRVSIMGRYSDISNAPDLSKMYFVARADFIKAKDKIRLKLNSTSESYDPLIFSLGVDRTNCQDVMDFTNKGEVQGSSLFKIGIICNRKNSSGRIAILGTEFSDLKTIQQDEKIPALWLNTMLNTSLNNKKVD